MCPAKWKIVPSFTPLLLYPLLLYPPPLDLLQDPVVVVAARPHLPYVAAVQTPPATAFLPAGTPPNYFGPQTSSPYIQRSNVVSAVLDDDHGVEEGRLMANLSALSLAAGRPEAAIVREAAQVAVRRVSEPAGGEAAARLQQQQRIGIPVLESFGGRPPMPAAVYPSRSGPPPTVARRPQYHHHQSSSTAAGVDSRGEHEDIKVIHFGVV